MKYYNITFHKGLRLLNSLYGKHMEHIYESCNLKVYRVTLSIVINLSMLHKGKSGKLRMKELLFIPRYFEIYMANAFKCI